MTIRNLFPDVRPALNLDFANTKRLDPRITFTRGSTGTYVDELGVIKTAASNEARFDHDGSGNSLGLLIEESRTNAITYSTAPDAEFSQDSANFTYTFNQAAPDGTNTAHLITNTSNTSTNRGGYFSAYAAIPTTGKITVSVFVKPVGNQVIYLGGDPGNQGYFGVPIVYYDFTVSPPEAVVNSNSGTPAAYGLTAEAFLEDIGNGWYRLIEVIDLTGHAFANGQTRGPRVCPVTTGTSCYVWGYQIETGSFATSYIPTSGSTATRSADVASMTGTNFSSWYNSSEGTLLIQASNIKETKSCSALTSGITGTPDTIYIYRRNATQWRIYNTTQITFDDSSDVANVAVGYSVDGTTRTAKAAWKGTLVNVATDSSHIDFAYLQIGAGPKSTGQSCGHTSRLTYYDRRLTDAQLQALTL